MATTTIDALRAAVQKSLFTQAATDQLQAALHREFDAQLKYPDLQKPALDDLAKLLPRLDRLDAAVKLWGEKHINTWGRELEFKKADWVDHVLPAITNQGGLTPEELSQITRDFYRVLKALSGQLPQDQSVSEADGDQNIRGIGQLIYNRCAMTPPLRDIVRHGVATYLNAKQFLEHYADIECDASGCSDLNTTEVDFANLLFLNDVSEGVNTAEVKSDRGASCFSGGTYVMDKQYRLIRMDELSNWYDLPELASWDECSGGVVFQTPTKVIVHKNETTLMNHLVIEAVDGTSRTLNVTPDHPLLMLKGGFDVWTPAGQLKAGDFVQGEGKAYRVLDNLAECGVFTTYNLSFTTDDGHLHPTFMVSPDGKSWLAAHNWY